MRSEVQDLLIKIIRSELTGECGSSFQPNEQVVKLALKHQLSHLVFHAYAKSGEKKYNPYLYRNILVVEQQKNALDKIRKSFSENKIPFLPLKGSVLRSLYPEDWMRNSCDIDVLVKREDLETAGRILSSLGYAKHTVSGHDVSYHTGAVRIELHFALIEDYRYPQISAVLEKVWDEAQQVGDFEYVMRDEMLYLFHIAHMMKHFENGGCGVRPFMDLWLLHHKKAFDRERRERLLRQCGILRFSAVMERLADAWFSEANADGLEQLEAFVFDGEAYGTVENRVAVKKQKRGGSVAYLRSRIFVPYARLKEQYPILQKKKYLLPFYQVVRWTKMWRRKGRYVQELKESVSVTTDKKVNELLKSLGL